MHDEFRERAEKYTYHVEWSYEYNLYQATCEEFANISSKDKTSALALQSLKDLVAWHLSEKARVGMIGFAPEPKSREKRLESALRGLLAWTDSGACSDREPFREAPACISFQHERGCGHLESINDALIVLGALPEDGHSFPFPKEEMRRLAEERSASYNKRKNEQ